MSISSTTNRVTYTGNGSTATYSYTFRIFTDDDLKVVVKNTSTGVETTLTKTVDYTVTGVTDAGGGTIILVDDSQAWIDGSSYLATGYTLNIRRFVALTQETDIRNQGDFFPETHEDVFDYSRMIDQQQQDEIDRSVKNPEGVLTSTFDPTLPGDIATASVAIVTNSSGDGLEIGPTIDEISNAQGYATAAAASAVAAADSETAAALSEANAATSETNAGNSETAAAASAAAAAAAVSSALYRDIVYIDNSDSPVTISQSDNGKLYSVDTSGGAVSVTIPEIAGLTLPFNISFVLATAGNDLTLNRSATDTIGGETSQVLSVAGDGVQLVADTDASPDDYATLFFGTDKVDKSTLTTKGDIYVATASAAITRLGAGSDGQVLTANSAEATGLEWSAASGGGGSKNYFSTQNSTGETGLATFGSWSTDDGAGGTAVYLSATATTTSSVVLEGLRTASFFKNSNDASGEFFKVTLDDIDRGDQGRPLFGSFMYDCEDLIYSNYAYGDLAIEAYDNDNAEVLYCGVDSALEIPSGKGIFNFVVYPNPNTESIEFRIKINSTNAGSYRVYFDEFKLGPAAQINAPVITEWQSYTPTGSWTGNVTYTGFYKRVGSTIDLDIRVLTTGAPTGTTLTVDIPSVFTIDTSYLTDFDDGISNLNGSASVADVGTANYNAVIRYSDTNSISVRYDTGTGTNAGITPTAPMTFANGDYVKINISSLPIVDLSAGALVSENELSHQTIRARYAESSAIAQTGAFAIVDFNEVEYDTHSIVTTGAGWRATFPKSGYYTIKGLFTPNSAGTNANQDNQIIVDGSTSIADWDALISSAGNTSMPFQLTKYFNKDQYISFRTANSQSASSVASATKNYIEIESLPDFTVLGAVQDRSRPVRFTPTYSAALTVGNGTHLAWWYRDGKFMVGHARFTFGSTSAISGNPIMTIPGGYALDTNFGASDSSYYVGSGFLLDAGTARYKSEAGISTGSTTAIQLGFLNSSASVANFNATTPFTWTTNDAFDFDFKIPIAGW